MNLSVVGDGPRIVGYVPGGWDMFHVGHLNILSHARKHCDVLIVGAVTDEALEEMKGRRPIIPLAERMAILEALSMVDKVVVDTSSDKVKVWEQVHFDVLFKGDDWKGTAKGERLEKAMAGVGVRVIYFPYTRSTSSTQLRAALGERLG
ncbi:adenylyltransferase/cytidyltransferase family protein [Tessaracoccus palaemonis]|uniref:Adenylyltransferase/cytidyltransferase family protein n=1 Tax=Tessaracoccus palaemonis TaxID=2829499 RepID=A0ABX8SJD5_9ACTN|nr:adenylyltransferase/cytidyltransferase family protein [Tessaracoccus palaemonis]QXT63428.1 adenylyltransferase/cytidyltransferase family protein [Tessaracoccus palaemonis]